jgi:hypothetical protein
MKLLEHWKLRADSIGSESLSDMVSLDVFLILNSSSPKASRCLGDEAGLLALCGLLESTIGTVKLILTSLRDYHTSDPRDRFRKVSFICKGGNLISFPLQPIFRQEIKYLKDITIGTQLEGTVSISLIVSLFLSINLGLDCHRLWPLR